MILFFLQSRKWIHWKYNSRDIVAHWLTPSPFFPSITVLINGMMIYGFHNFQASALRLLFNKLFKLTTTKTLKLCIAGPLWREAGTSLIRGLRCGNRFHAMGSPNTLITMMSQWAWWRLRSPTSRLFTQPFIRAQIKENIKAPRHWPLCGEFTGTGEFPAQMANNAENVSIEDVIMWR